MGTKMTGMVPAFLLITAAVIAGNIVYNQWQKRRIVKARAPATPAK